MFFRSFYGIVILLVLIATLQDFVSRRKSTEGAETDEKAEGDEEPTEDVEPKADEEHGEKKETGKKLLNTHRRRQSFPSTNGVSRNDEFRK